LFLLVLLAVTFPLWLGSSDMPSIPLVDVGIRLPGFVSAITFIVLLAGLLGVVIAPDRCRKVWWVVAGCLGVCFLLDQHRLQPWAYQSAIYALLFACMSPQRARRYLIPLAASVYLYSAAGKFDYQFMHTVGQDFLQTITRPLGGLPDRFDDSLRARLTLIFPAAEFAIGLGLLFRVSRRGAAAGVMLMHVSLILVLGPWGLDHSTGVLVWNGLLILQAYLLMFRSPSHDGKDARENIPSPGEPNRRPARASVASFLVSGVVLVALMAPLLERRGYWDHWTSWSLYSPHTSRVEIEVHQSAVDRLPPALQPLVAQDSGDDGWQQVEIGRWSLESRRVPIYPQARYQLALAAQIARRAPLDREIRARLRGVADRWSGRRDEVFLLGRGEIERGLQRFWLTSQEQAWNMF
jgi:hypothetical protein